MPNAHRAHQQWTPWRLLNWARDIGDHTHALTQRIIDSKAHPEQAYRACLGLLNLARRYGPQRLDLACARAIAIGSPTRRSVASILTQRMDQLPLPLDPPASTTTNTPEHDNIRGPDYYQH
jgi:transposase